MAILSSQDPPHWFYRGETGRRTEFVAFTVCQVLYWLQMLCLTQSSPQLWEVDTPVTLQLKKLNFRELKKLGQGHTAGT